MGDNCVDSKIGLITAPASSEAKRFEGWHSALKPAFEQWWLVRKPLSEPTIAENVLRWSTGGINVDACRVATGDDTVRTALTNGLFSSDAIDRRMNGGNELGRFPSHLTHDGSEVVEAEFAKAGVRSSGAKLPVEVNNSNATVSFIGKVRHNSGVALETSTGSASRFFYCAKPSPRERNEGLDGNRNIHPTLKSLSLMSYMCKMITPKGGTVLDCFMGSGTTGMSAIKEGFNFIGIEKERNYFEIAEARIRHAALGQQGTIIAPEPLPVKPKVKLQMEMF